MGNICAQNQLDDCVYVLHALTIHDNKPYSSRLYFYLGEMYRLKASYHLRLSACSSVPTYAEAMKAMRMLFEAFQLQSPSRAFHLLSRNKLLMLYLLAVTEACWKGRDFFEKILCHFQKKTMLRMHDSIVLFLLQKERQSNPNLLRLTVLDWVGYDSRLQWQDIQIPLAIVRMLEIQM